MNKETAFRVLGLSASASLDQAKNAYRKLAKKYHPDVVENKTADAFFSDSKMKEINLAFRFLVPYLKPEPISEKMGKDKPFCKKKPGESIHSKKKFRVNIFSVLKIFFVQGASALRQKQRTKTAIHSRSKTRQSIHNKETFDNVLKAIFSAGVNASPLTGVNAKRTKCRPNLRPGRQTRFTHSRYQQYMKMRKRYQPLSARKTQDIGIERVTKIDPVSPVDPVTKFSVRH
ncbi:MAG: DnaJ domain-containing protein [Desulfobacula sp.]|nr:DnaJ domain-containing protein [Desulfobacula sp.]